jgi:hypothetical protein
MSERRLQPYWLVTYWARWKGGAGFPWFICSMLFHSMESAEETAKIYSDPAKQDDISQEMTGFEITGPFYKPIPEAVPAKSNRRGRKIRKGGTGRPRRSRSAEPAPSGSATKPARSKRANPRR